MGKGEEIWDKNRKVHFMVEQDWHRNPFANLKRRK